MLAAVLQLICLPAVCCLACYWITNRFNLCNSSSLVWCESGALLTPLFAAQAPPRLSCRSLGGVCFCLSYTSLASVPSVNNPYLSVGPEAQTPLRSSLRAKSKGFPKERFLSIVLTRICKSNFIVIVPIYNKVVLSSRHRPQFLLLV